MTRLPAPIKQIVFQALLQDKIKHLKDFKKKSGKFVNKNTADHISSSFRNYPNFTDSTSEKITHDFLIKENCVLDQYDHVFSATCLPFCATCLHFCATWLHFSLTFGFFLLLAYFSNTHVFFGKMFRYFSMLAFVSNKFVFLWNMIGYFSKVFVFFSNTFVYFQEYVCMI